MDQQLAKATGETKAKIEKRLAAMKADYSRRSELLKRGWILMSGITDLILVAIIMDGWPGSAGWALGVIVGANLISSGISIIMVALAARRIVKLIGEAP